MNPARNNNTKFLRAQVLNGWNRHLKLKAICNSINNLNGPDDKIKFNVRIFITFQELT